KPIHSRDPATVAPLNGGILIGMPILDASARASIPRSAIFDHANRYCVPHRYVGRRLTVKADSSSVAIYNRVEEVVSSPRAYPRDNHRPIRDPQFADATQIRHQSYLNEFGTDVLILESQVKIH